MPKKKAPKKETVRTIQFDYIKSPQFKSVYADGVYGGPTLRGMIQLVFFTERKAIPTRIECQLLPDGRLGKELKREGRPGFVREMDVSVVMTLPVAKSMYTWLGEKIELLSKAAAGQRKE